MFSMNQNRHSLRTFGIICLMLVQAVFPSMVSAQVTQGSGGNVTSGSGVGVGGIVGIVGIVNSLSGPAFVRLASGAEVPVKPGDVIGSGSIVRTGLAGEIILLFADGLHVSLTENSQLNVEEYRFNPGNSSMNRAIFTLISGSMRLVTGAMHVANPQAMSVRGDNALITVVSRDVTSFVVQIGREEEVDVAVVVGQVSIRSPDGRTDSIAQDQFARWRRGAASVLLQPLAAAPASLQALARSPALAQDATMDDKVAAELAKFLGSLPAPAAGEVTTAEPRVSLAEFILPVVTPGSGGGCVGSPC